MDLLTKPLDKISRDDVLHLVTEGVPEGTQVEFKQALPSNKGMDPWEAGADHIGDKARNELLEVVVAFANAHGGNLVIGVGENADEPARAASVPGIGRCAALAEKLRLQARDCIEPQVPLLGSIGIPMEDDGRGVVVVRVPRSRLAPHRLAPTKECYVRRADRSEKMTMREIQDLTIQTERGMAAVDARFAEQHARFHEMLESIRSLTKFTVGLRVTLVPLDASLRVSPVHGNPKVSPPYVPLRGGHERGRYAELVTPRWTGFTRPTLRGTKVVADDGQSRMYREVKENGVIEYAFGITREDAKDALLYPEWLIGFVANALLAAHKFRIAVGAPDAEYALEIEAVMLGGALRIGGFGEDKFGTRTTIIEKTPLLFPRLSVGPMSDFSSLVTIVLTDLWHAAEQDETSPFFVDFESAWSRIIGP